MSHRFKCPVCGALGYASALDRYFPLQVYFQKSLGKAHGFRMIPVEDPDLVSRVKTKIQLLSRILFPPVGASLSPIFGARLDSHMVVAIKSVAIVKPRGVSAYIRKT